jgi:hypothetical protein
VIVSQEEAAAGEDVFVGGASLLLLAERSQVKREATSRSESVGVVVAQNSSETVMRVLD